MKRFHQSIALLGLGLALGAGTCKNEEDMRKSCEGVMCTMMFAAVTTQVQDAAGNPVALDSTRISSTSLGISIPGKPGLNGGYTIVDDGQLKQLAQRSGTVTFSGFLAGREVVREAFVVKADCCHVSRVSGPELITLK